MRLESAKRALKSTNERLCRSSRQENPIIRYGYNVYMAHHYAYMTKVAKIQESESYAEAAHDAKWRAAIEEEMHALADNETIKRLDCPTTGPEEERINQGHNMAKGPMKRI